MLHTAAPGPATPSAVLQPSLSGWWYPLLKGQCLGDPRPGFSPRPPFLIHCRSLGEEFLCSSALSPVKWRDEGVETESVCWVKHKSSVINTQCAVKLTTQQIVALRCLAQESMIRSTDPKTVPVCSFLPSVDVLSS